jgi:hypothetical protein
MLTVLVVVLIVIAALHMTDKWLPAARPGLATAKMILQAVTVILTLLWLLTVLYLNHPTFEPLGEHPALHDSETLERGRR